MLILIEPYAYRVMERMGPGPKGSEKPGRRAWKKEKEVTPGTEDGWGKAMPGRGRPGS